MVCQTAKSIEDVLRLALRITSEDERRNVRPGMKVSYFFRGENQNYQDREHDVYPSAGFKPGIYRNPKHLARETWFVNEAIRLFPEEFQSDHTTFERLTRLQHFGFPTRLADVTQNLFVATAFACMKGYDDPAKLPADQRMGFVHIYRITITSASNIRQTGGFCRSVHAERRRKRLPDLPPRQVRSPSFRWQRKDQGLHPPRPRPTTKRWEEISVL